MKFFRLKKVCSVTLNFSTFFQIYPSLELGKLRFAPFGQFILDRQKQTWMIQLNFIQFSLMHLKPCDTNRLQIISNPNSLRKDSDKVFNANKISLFVVLNESECKKQNLSCLKYSHNKPSPKLSTESVELSYT